MKSWLSFATAAVAAALAAAEGKLPNKNEWL
jgi:hypothetical protein